MSPTILEHLNGYTYRDTYDIPPQYPKNQTNDLVAQLEALPPSIFNNTTRVYITIIAIITSLTDTKPIFIASSFSEFSLSFYVNSYFT